MDSGFLKEEIHRFQIFSAEIIVSVAAFNAFWAKRGRHEQSVVTFCPLRLWFNDGWFHFQELANSEGFQKGHYTSLQRIYPVLSGQEPPGCCEILFPFPSSQKPEESSPRGWWHHAGVSTCKCWQHSLHSASWFQSNFRHAVLNPFFRRRKLKIGQQKPKMEKATMNEMHGRFHFSVSTKSHMKSPPYSTVSVHFLVFHISAHPSPRPNCSTPNFGAALFDFPDL